MQQQPSLSVFVTNTANKHELHGEPAAFQDLDL